MLFKNTLGLKCPYFWPLKILFASLKIFFYKNKKSIFTIISLLLGNYFGCRVNLLKIFCLWKIVLNWGIVWNHANRGPPVPCFLGPRQLVKYKSKCLLQINITSAKLRTGHFFDLNFHTYVIYLIYNELWGFIAYDEILLYYI
jgi:hypothetical protein